MSITWADALTIELGRWTYDDFTFDERDSSRALVIANGFRQSLVPLRATAWSEVWANHASCVESVRHPMPLTDVAQGTTIAQNLRRNCGFSVRFAREMVR
ncbi:MAG TPA: hypothetical protein VIV60_06345 [Polyangiaceae bacterium]